TAERPPEQSAKGPLPPPGGKDLAREKFALALARLIDAEGAGHSEKQLIERYQHLAKSDADLRVDDPKAQALVGLVSELAKYSPEKITRLIQESLGDPELVKMIGERVKARLAENAGRP